LLPLPLTSFALVLYTPGALCCLFNNLFYLQPEILLYFLFHVFLAMPFFPYCYIHWGRCDQLNCLYLLSFSAGLAGPMGLPSSPTDRLLFTLHRYDYQSYTPFHFCRRPRNPCSPHLEYFLIAWYIQMLY
jgi:hypothetical protein